MSDLHIDDLPRSCECCGGFEQISEEHKSCDPCLAIWFDEGEVVKSRIGEISRARKATGEYPWEPKP